MNRRVLVIPLLLAGLCTATPGGAQEFVKIDILPKFEEIPIPPVSADEAYARAECDASCSVDAFFAPVETMFGDIARRMELLQMALASQITNPYAGMDPAELQARVQAMTPQEQMEFAMEMSRAGAGGGAARPESPAVRDAVNEAYRIVEAIGDDAIREGEGVPRFPTRVGRMQDELRARHGEISTWEATERRKLREPTPDEDAGPYIAATAAIRREAARRHVAAEDEFLRALSGMWREELQHQRTRFSSFEPKLAAVGYGEDAVGRASRDPLVGTQRSMLEPVRVLLGASKDATRNAAEWWHRKVMLEQELERDAR